MSQDQSVSEQQTTAVIPSRPPTRYRWFIAWLLSLGVVINYVDRANFSTAVPSMAHDLHFGVTQIGLLSSIWAWGYVAAMLPGSWLGDRWGVRKSYAAFAGGWGIIQAATGLGTSMSVLAWLRALLGIGEAPSYPLNAAVTSKWFGTKERALGVAIYDSGAKLGQVVGPLLATLILVTLDWRWAFYITGALAVLWGLVWYIAYRDPWHKRGNQAEIEYITREGAQSRPNRPQSLTAYYAAWLKLFRNSNTWALSIGNFAYIFASYIWFTFLPTMLRDTFHVHIVATGLLTALPFLLSWLAELFSAWLMNALIRHLRLNITKTRKVFAIVGFVVTSAAALLYFYHSLFDFELLVIVSNIGVGIVAPALWSLPADLAPQGMGASLAGIMNTIGFVGAIIGPLLTGFILAATGSPALPLVIAACVLVVAAVVIAVWVHDADTRITFAGTQGESVADG
jgi:ACS family D-galactonate transporter-like MFS transporter